MTAAPVRCASSKAARLETEIAWALAQLERTTALPLEDLSDSAADEMERRGIGAIFAIGPRAYLTTAARWRAHEERKAVQP